MFHREITAVYCNNHMKCTDSPVGNMQSFMMSKQALLHFQVINGTNYQDNLDSTYSGWVK